MVMLEKSPVDWAAAYRFLYPNIRFIRVPITPLNSSRYFDLPINKPPHYPVVLTTTFSFSVSHQEIDLISSFIRSFIYSIRFLRNHYSKENSKFFLLSSSVFFSLQHLELP
ncbi:hypothetical protein B9Z55_010080 [Caenorhabditis nigoni]|uniref:Uncharacterized protein n=1 Tax=Caenorhabditis nigoni TaxID=1611254 RepID=A0A2G5UEG6_9PELO|nr:hypothetical protein B9Z55_010080 [Caenorhabditis nigoni]